MLATSTELPCSMNLESKYAGCPGSRPEIGGIFTFGAPRIGDAESVRISSALYRGRFFRYMHASDMVCSSHTVPQQEVHVLCTASTDMLSSQSRCILSRKNIQEAVHEDSS